ncbi:MAG: hypothetical protein Q9174_004048 [Haloplaca sp. 1 TL-2023]
MSYEPGAKKDDARLRQSTLENAFGNVRVSRNVTVDLHPSRRANLKGPPPPLPSSKCSTLLAAVAAETIAVLPGVLKALPNAQAFGELLKPDTLIPARRSACPELRKTPIRVLNMDTLDAAMTSGSLTSSSLAHSTSPPVLVLNMANAKHPGGGWTSGAIAQEEALCYRSSLPISLKRRFYPMSERSAIYSSRVVVIRENLANGHQMLDLTRPRDLPLVSVVSMAALRDPPVQRSLGNGDEIYVHASDRDTMKAKIRMVLRIATAKHHRKLVLGALGCGAFGNPKNENVRIWKEVFAEPEFNGGWWEGVIFAVMDNGAGRDSNSNYGVFWQGLDGLEV